MPVITEHGARTLPSVDVDSYNLEIRDEDGFVGDRASHGAFKAIIDEWREPLRKLGDDPLGDQPTKEVSKKELDAILAEGAPEAGGLIHSAIEAFAKELEHVIRRFLKTASWRDTEAIVIGGGFRQSRVGELAIGRTGVLLKSGGTNIELELISNHPDEAGLIGCAHLMPAWTLEGFDGLMAVDIGGTNIRAGVVETNLKKSSKLDKAGVWKSELWRHGDEKTKRDEAVDRLIDMLKDLIKAAGKSKLNLAPVIGIGCPGLIREDGSIETGAQNLPGNWESKTFNLPNCIIDAIPEIGKHETAVAMHNDAVVQGLSELPRMREYDRWGVLTIGTGLGNARFTTRRKKS
ncbi:ROK family protein [Hyphomicrobium sp.]|uniref:ROK family protein n=1 Tax=Hyphomicrobium sp. TaxID=82 RepID=UPI002E2FFF53|nr:ROK family protein [Hyphomicrobium sp.]HEX2840513.1 ROK family protein [Hyphomicrobium sp.]